MIEERKPAADVEYYFTALNLGTVNYSPTGTMAPDCTTYPVGSEDRKQCDCEKGNGCTNVVYFYHSDHLGSSTYLTDANGEAYQFLLYLPFGESMAEQKVAGYGTPYQFTGQELDAETGLYNYGARYYDPRVSLFYGVDQLTSKYPNHSPFTYTANNPVLYIDPDGRKIFPVHGTWSNNKTWEDLDGIATATNKLFSDNKKGKAFQWSGGNYSQARTIAAKELINHIISERKGGEDSEPITLVGHSHGGNVAIEAINIMAEMNEFDGVEINLLSINTPVRDDYQLSKKAAARVNHVNVFDPKDPVQSNAGNSQIVLRARPLLTIKGTGEFGRAGREFDNANNIKVNSPQGLIMSSGGSSILKFGDIHNSHNRVFDWIGKIDE